MSSTAFNPVPRMLDLLADSLDTTYNETRVYRSVGSMAPSPAGQIRLYDPDVPKPNCRNCGARYHEVACDYCETPSP